MTVDATGPAVPLVRIGASGPVVSRIGLGLAALGRPAYITSGRGVDLPDRSVAGLRARTSAVLDAAYAAGIRYFDAARSYGRAEEFLAGWLAAGAHDDAVAGSKWGYRYTGDWRLNAKVNEVKEHSLAMFTRQLGQTRALLKDRLALYQVHSLTEDSPLLGDHALLAAMAALRDQGVLIGLSTSGPRQADTVRRALAVTAGGAPMFAAVQVTWNLLEPSVGDAAAEAAQAGCAVLVKEPVANGRLAPGGDAARPDSPLARFAARASATPDAIAIAAALAQPWATVVLSGAVSTAQLQSNLAALRFTTSSSIACRTRIGRVRCGVLVCAVGTPLGLRTACSRQGGPSRADASMRSPSSSQSMVLPARRRVRTRGWQPGMIARWYSISAVPGSWPLAASSSSTTAQCTALLTCPAVSKSTARSGQSRDGVLISAPFPFNSSAGTRMRETNGHHASACRFAVDRHEFRRQRHRPAVGQADGRPDSCGLDEGPAVLAGQGGGALGPARACARAECRDRQPLGHLGQRLDPQLAPAHQPDDRLAQAGVG